jgi:cleavage and polyadenylation specificity factor subunit 1
MKEGHFILYQFLEQNINHSFAFRRIRTRKFTSAGKASKVGAIVPFKGVNGLSGAFVCTGRPMFLLSESGYPRLIDAPIGTFFAQFRSEFIFGSPTIARLADFSNMTADGLDTYVIGGCVVQRKPLGETPRLITFAPSWRALVLITSRPVPFILEYERDAKDIEPEDGLTPHYQKPPTPPRELEGDGYPSNFEEKYQGYILADTGMTPALNFERHEVCTSIAFVRTLSNYQDQGSNLSEYLAVGTSYMCHEERTMRGKIAIYKGTLIINEEKGINEYELRRLFDKDKQPPVTAISELDGFITAFMGGQLLVYMFLNEEAIKQASFLAGHFYCNQLLSLKNYLLFVDAFRGFQLARWRSYGSKMITMAKDFQTFCPLSAAFLTDRGGFGGVVFDNFGNAQVFDYDEYAIPVDAFVVKSVFHVGCRALNAGHFPTKGASQNEIRGHFSWFVSDKGKFGIFSPLKDDTERRRLCVVQANYEKALVGFSHLDYRTGKFATVKNQEQITASPRLVVDMDLLADLVESPPDLLRQCVKALGRSMMEILGALSDVASAAAIFQ